MSKLRCRCGSLQGNVDARHLYGRAVCYCKDCQGFARFLGSPEQILNGQGGTEIVAILPAAVHFTAGLDKLACMSLSDQGLLRWYAACCRTPVGNTPRDHKIPYVGLVRACLPELDESFGPLKIAINTGSATDVVKATPVMAFLGLMRIMRKVIAARLRGKYKENPFFTSKSGEPIRTPQVLTLAERMSLQSAR